MHHFRSLDNELGAAADGHLGCLPGEKGKYVSGKMGVHGYLSSLGGGGR